MVIFTDFSIDYDAILDDDILSIPTYLIKKNDIVSNIWICKANICLSMIFFGRNLSNVNSLKCIPVSNQACKVRSKYINVNSDEPLFYPYSVKINKYSGSCDNVNNPYAKMCIPEVDKIINLKVFNLISITNETRYIKLHETYKCKCRLDASVCNDKQRRNEDKCRCKCKELIDNSCDKGFICNASNCECECDKLFDVGEYLDYENCKCRKKLLDKLVEECIEDINEKEIYLAKLHLKETICPVCSSCTIYTISFSLFFAKNHWNCYLFCFQKIHG